MLGATSTLDESIFRRSLGNNLFCCRNVDLGNLLETALTVPDPSMIVHEMVETSGDIGFNTFDDENSIEELALALASASLKASDDDDELDDEVDDEDAEE